MKVAFRTDASDIIGTGHVMRCLALAEILNERGVLCSFICRKTPGNLISLLEKRDFEVQVLTGKKPLTHPVSDSNKFREADGHAGLMDDAASTAALLSSRNHDWLIVDHYAIDHRWENILRYIVGHIMVIDDLADRMHHCDLLLDQNFIGPNATSRYKGLIPDSCKQLLGPAYALMGTEYKDKRTEPERKGEIKRILVYMGGCDLQNSTATVLEALSDEAFDHIHVDVVLGINHPNPKIIEEIMKNRHLTRLYKNLKSLSDLMSQADLMIGAGGTTNWERMCKGLPGLLISIAKNQQAVNQALSDEDYVNYLGDRKRVHIEDIRNALHLLLKSPEKLSQQSKKCTALVDGKGADKVANILFSFDDHAIATVR